MELFGPFFPLPLPPPCFQAEPVLPFSPVPLKRRHKHSKKDKAFLLVEIRTAIQRDSRHCFYAQVYYNLIGSSLPFAPFGYSRWKEGLTTNRRSHILKCLYSFKGHKNFSESDFLKWS
jgi:hypothetical protein